MLKFLILFFILLTPDISSGKTLHLEKVYQEFWCANYGGEAEVTLSDRTRVDCLTDNYAVEVDFASKWAEAIGQSLYYSARTGKKPGILLIIEKNPEKRYLRRLNFAIDEAKLPIKVWLISPRDVK